MSSSSPVYTESVEQMPCDHATRHADTQRECDVGKDDILPLTESSKDVDLALFRAASNGDLKAVSRLLRSGQADVNATHPFKNYMLSPVDIAAYQGHVETVRYLMCIDAVRYANENDALYFAAFRDHAKVASVLLESSVLGNGHTAKVATTMHAAAQEGHVDVLDVLLNSVLTCKDVNKYDAEMRTPLHVAIECEDADVVKKLLESAEIDLSIKNGYDETALECAIKYGLEDVMGALLRDERTDVSILDEMHTDAEWMPPCAERYIDKLFAAILKNERKISMAWRSPGGGRKPLHYAAKNDNAALIIQLIEYLRTETKLTAEFKAQVNDDDTKAEIYTDESDCLEEGTFFQNLLPASKEDGITRENTGVRVKPGVEQPNVEPGEVQADIDFRDEVNATDCRGRMPLHYAVVNDHVECVGVLLRNAGKKIDVNAVDLKGDTPLLLALKCGSVRSALLLLRHPTTDVTITDKFHRNVLHASLSNRSNGTEEKVDSMVECLLRNPEVTFDATDISGRNCLHYAAENADVGVLSALLRDERVKTLLHGCDCGGETPLTKALNAGLEENVGKLLEVAVDATDVGGRNCLHYAADNADVGVLSALLRDERVKTLLHGCDRGGETPLTRALNAGLEENVGKLMEVIGEGKWK